MATVLESSVIEECEESSAARDAINVHKWYIGERLGDVSFEVARDSFVVNAMMDWVEFNSPDSRDLNGQRIIYPGCVFVLKSNMLQILAISRQIRNSNFLTEEEAYIDPRVNVKDFFRENINPSDAQEFYDNKLSEFAPKFRRAYCGHICPARVYCYPARQNIRSYKK
jgi:hypothetical protein